MSCDNMALNYISAKRHMKTRVKLSARKRDMASVSGLCENRARLRNYRSLIRRLIATCAANGGQQN
jgi:hypothetical protein